MESMKYCLESPRNEGKKAECAEVLYRDFSRISDDEYGKLPVLRMATSLYALLTKVDRKQIDHNTFRIQIMQLQNDFASDVKNAQQRSLAENRAAAAYQQQMFLNAQRLLSPPGSVISCYRAPGSPVTTCQ